MVSCRWYASSASNESRLHDCFSDEILLESSLVWCTTAVLSIIPLLAGAYGPAGVWCWIKKTGPGLPLRFLMFYIPLYICIAVMLYLYSAVVRTVNATMEGQTDLEEEDRKRAQRALTRLKGTPTDLLTPLFLPLSCTFSS